MHHEGRTRELVGCIWEGHARYAWLCARYDVIEREFPELTVYRWPPPEMVRAIEGSPEFEGEIDVSETESGLLHHILQAREGE